MAKHGYIGGADPASILQENKEVQALGGARHMDGFGTHMHIPNEHLAKWKQRYPALDSPDPDVKSKAWKRFAAGEGKQYVVTRNRFI